MTAPDSSILFYHFLYPYFITNIDTSVPYLIIAEVCYPILIM